MASKTRKKRGRPSKAEEEARKFVETVTSLLSSYAAANPLDAIYRAEYLSKLIDQELERPVSVPPPIRGEHNVSVSVDLKQHQDAARRLIETFIASPATDLITNHVKQLHGKVKDFQPMLTNMPGMVSNFLFGVPGGLGAIFHVLSAIADSVGKLANNQEATAQQLEKAAKMYTEYINTSVKATKTEIPGAPPPESYAPLIAETVEKTHETQVGKLGAEQYAGNLDGFLRDACIKLFGPDYGPVAYEEVKKALEGKIVDFYIPGGLAFQHKLLQVEPTAAALDVGDTVTVQAWYYAKVVLPYTDRRGGQHTAEADVHLPIFGVLVIHAPDGTVKQLHVDNPELAKQLRDKGVTILLSKPGDWSITVKAQKPWTGERTVVYTALGKTPIELHIEKMTIDDLVHRIVTEFFPGEYRHVAVRYIKNVLSRRLQFPIYVAEVKLLHKQFVAYVTPPTAKTGQFVYIHAYWKIVLRIVYTTDPKQPTVQTAEVEVKLPMFGHIHITWPDGLTCDIDASTLSSAQALMNGDVWFPADKPGYYTVRITSTLPWSDVVTLKVLAASVVAPSPHEVNPQLQKSLIHLYMEIDIMEDVDETIAWSIDKTPGQWDPLWIAAHWLTFEDVKGRSQITYATDLRAGPHRLYIVRSARAHAKWVVKLNDSIIELDMDDGCDGFIVSFVLQNDGAVVVTDVKPHHGHLTWNVVLPQGRRVRMMV